MSNRKLLLWARLTRRTVCACCGELYATTTLPEGGLCSGMPGCEYCAAQYTAGWIGCPEDDIPWRDAMDALPWLLRHRDTARSDADLPGGAR